MEKKHLGEPPCLFFEFAVNFYVEFLTFGGWNCFRGINDCFFTIDCCPFSSYITPKLHFKILTPESFEHILSLVRGLNIFLSGLFVFYIVDIFFPSNILV